MTGDKTKKQLIIFGYGIFIIVCIGWKLKRAMRRGNAITEYVNGGNTQNVMEGWESYDTDINGTKLIHPKCATCRSEFIGKRVATWKNGSGEIENCLMPNKNISGNYFCRGGDFIGVGTKSFGEYDSSQPSSGEKLATNNTEFNDLWKKKKASAEVTDSNGENDKINGAEETIGTTHISTSINKTTASTAAPVVPLNFCSKCGNRLHGNKHFCSNCGARGGN